MMVCVRGKGTMKIRTCEHNEENIIQFEDFKNLSSEYRHREKTVKELRRKKEYGGGLDKYEGPNLSFSEGYCRGYIDAVHRTMKKLHIATKEVQLKALENLKEALCEDVDSEIRALKNQLEQNYCSE
jgi:hypothetical protein